MVADTTPDVFVGYSRRLIFLQPEEDQRWIHAVESMRTIPCCNLLVALRRLSDLTGVLIPGLSGGHSPAPAL